MHYYHHSPTRFGAHCAIVRENFWTPYIKLFSVIRDYLDLNGPTY